jgi:hypothetical protein
MKDLHLFIHDHTLSDAKLPVKGLKDFPVLIHHLISSAPVIISRGFHEPYGLCNNDPHGSFICIPNYSIDHLGVPIDLAVPHHVICLNADSAEALKPAPHMFPVMNQTLLTKKLLLLFLFHLPSMNLSFCQTLWLQPSFKINVLPNVLNQQ